MYVSSTYKLFISSKPSLCQTQQWNVSTYSCSFYMLFRDLAEVTHVMCFSFHSLQRQGPCFRQVYAPAFQGWSVCNPKVIGGDLWPMISGILWFSPWLVTVQQGLRPPFHNLYSHGPVIWREACTQGEALFLAPAVRAHTTPGSPASARPITMASVAFIFYWK